MTGLTGGRELVHLPEAEATMGILLREADADGSLGAVATVLPPGSHGPPLHRRPGHAEPSFVLGGALTLRLGDRILTGGPGTWGCAPRHAAHTLANFGEAPARVRCLSSPGGFERRCQRMVASPEEAEVLAELHEHERGTELLDPPIQPDDLPDRPS